MRNFVKLKPKNVSVVGENICTLLVQNKAQNKSDRNSKILCVNLSDGCTWTGSSRMASILTPAQKRKWTKKEKPKKKNRWWLLIIGNSQGVEGSAVTQTRHSETPRSKSITATTPLCLNITLRLRGKLAVEPSGGSEAAHGHKEKDGEERDWKVSGANQEKWAWMATQSDEMVGRKEEEEEEERLRWDEGLVKGWRRIIRMKGCDEKERRDLPVGAPLFNPFALIFIAFIEEEQSSHTAVTATVSSNGMREDHSIGVLSCTTNVCVLSVLMENIFFRPTVLAISIQGWNGWRVGSPSDSAMWLICYLWGDD